MADGLESVVLEVDPRSIHQAIVQANKDVESWEKGIVGAGDRMQKSLERMADMLIKVNDKQRNSLERLTQAIEKQAAAYGKTGVERLIAERDRIIQKLGVEEGLVNRVRAAYEKMIEAESGHGAGAGLGGIEKAATESRASLALLGEEIGVHIPRHIRSFVATMPGVGEALSVGFKAIAVVALIAVIVEAIKKVLEFKNRLEELRVATEREAGELRRFTDEQKSANDQLLVSNTRLENAIAKLREKPQNKLKEAIEEAAEAADHLSEKLDKALRSFYDILQKNAPGMFAQIVGRQPSTTDIREMVGGQSGYGGMIGELYAATAAGQDPSAIIAKYRARAAQMLRSSQYSQAYQEGLSFEGHPWDYRWPGSAMGLPPGITSVDVTQKQEPRIEVLNALIREMDLLTQAYSLEKRNNQLTGEKGHLEDQAEGAKKQMEALKEFERQAQEFIKKGDEAELDAIGKIYYQRDLLLKQAAQVKASEADIAGIRKSADEQAGKVLKESFEKFEEYDQKRRAEQQKRFMDLFLPSKEQMKEWEDFFKAQERIQDIDVQAQKEAMRHHANAQAKQAQTPEDAYQIRVDLAIKLAQVEVDRIRREDDNAKRMVMAAEAQKQLYTDLASAQDELDEKRAQAAEREAQETQHEFDTIKKEAAGLFHTLLTRPQDFAKQLGSTIREAILKPVTEGFGSMVATIMQPVVGGVGGLLKGVFGTKDPAKVSTDLNTAATMQNSAAVAMLTAVLAGYMGIGMPMFAAPSIPGIAGLPMPSFSAPASASSRSGLPKFADGGITNGPTIVGEAGPELVIPLNKLRNMGLPPSVNLVGHYGPETTEALGKATNALFDLALPAGLGALGGPAGISVGDSIMALLTGGVAAMTPPRHDDLLMGVVAPPGDLEPYYTARWVVNPRTGEILTTRLARFSAETDLLPEHHQLMASKGWPTSGRNYDLMHRGQAFLARDGTMLDLGDQSGEGFAEFAATYGTDAIRRFRPLTRSQAARLESHIMEMFENLLPRSASVRAPRDLEYMANSRRKGDPTFYIGKDNRDPYFNMTVEQREAAGRKGGLKSAKTWAIRRALQDPEIEPMTGRYIGPPVDVPETTHEAFIKLDQQFPWLKSNFDWNERVMFRGQSMRVEEAARKLKLNSGDVISWLKDAYPRANWSKVDVSTMPQHDEGGTIASTGLAVVHKGEAVIPQADSLKHSIDNLAGAMNSNATMFRWLLSGMLGGHMASFPLSIPHIGTLPIPTFFGGGGGGSTTLSISGGGGYSSLGGGSTVAEGGYTPAPWAWSRTGVPQSELQRIDQMVGGQGGKFLSKGVFSPKALNDALSNLKGTVWNSDAWNAYPWTTGGVLAGGAQAIATSPAAGMAGVSLAMSGLTGDRRGTWGGAMESAAGGALIGDQIGGPLGAAAGASFGFEVAMFEKLFGVESPENEAKRLVKQIYRITIDTSMAKHIVQIAQSKYAGHVSIAVRDPDVRKMLMLYSESTGQHMPLSATTPQSAALAESGGRLYQQATYVNGMPYTFQSNLPVLGGYPTGTYPTPGGAPLSLQVNVSGQGAAQFVAGQVVTPEFVQSQWSSAGASSNGRLQNSAMIQQPGLVIS